MPGFFFVVDVPVVGVPVVVEPAPVIEPLPIESVPVVVPVPVDVPVLGIVAGSEPMPEPAPMPGLVVLPEPVLDPGVTVELGVAGMFVTGGSLIVPDVDSGVFGGACSDPPQATEAVAKARAARRTRDFMVSS